MKRMRYLLVTLAIILGASSAQAATLAQIKNAIENFRATHGPKIVARQNAYAAAHGGRYWQGILTPSTTPYDGASVTADYSRRPTDQLERWSDIFVAADVLPANIPGQISVDVYDGPAGKGWTVTLVGTKAGIRYSRTWNVGPETSREQDWRSCVLPCGVLP